MRSNPKVKQAIRQTFYMLKQQYGVPCRIYKLTDSDTDYETGQTDNVVERRSVRLACLMPSEVARSNYFSPFYNQTNKPFITKGGMGWDEAARLFYIDGRDIPGYNFAVQDYIVCNGQRFDVLSFEEFGDKDGWSVWTTQALDTKPEEVWEQEPESSLSFEDSVDGEVEQ
jgi:hypothetical protein